MRPLNKATEYRFRPIIHDVPSYAREKFSHERISLVSTKRDDGTLSTVLDLYSVSEDITDQNKYYPQCNATMRLPERLFEKKYLTGNKYAIPLTDSNVELIWSVWPKSQLILNNLAKESVLKVIATGIRQDLNAENIANYKINQKLISDNCIEKLNAELLNYQKIARHCALHSEAFGLFMEQGTGKTPVAISTVVNDYLRSKTKIYRCLIICPKNIRFNWQNELEHFCPVPYRSTIIHGTKVEREMQLIEAIMPNQDSHISFVIASYGAVTNTESAFALKSVSGLKLADNLKWDYIIADEAHYLKSPSAKRTKIAHILRDTSKRRLALTGTPFVNSLFDLWGIWEFLGHNLSGFSNFHAFKDFHAVYDKVNNGRQKLISFDNVPLLQERIARTSFIISKKEALPELPERTYDIISCEMSKEQTDIYNQVANQLYVEIENELEASQNKELTINGILPKLLRLAQITAGFVVWDAKYSVDGEELESAQIDRFDPNNKLETLVEILKEKEDYEKTLIWSNFVPAIKFISARLKIENIDNVIYYGKTSDENRTIAENRFNCDPTCKVLVGNPSAGGVGLNLLGYDYRQQTDCESARLTNCTHEIYYSQNWSLTAREQSEARAHRKGTRSVVRVTDLCVPYSIDMEIKNRVTGKIKTANKLQDIKYILDNIAKPLEIESGD